MERTLPVGTRISWATDTSELATLRADWDALAQRTGAEVYLRPVWFETWWRHFGAGRCLLCPILYRDGHLVGLLPFAIDRVRVGPLRFRIARLAGTDPHCMVLRLPVEADLVDPMLTETVRRLLGPERCDVVSFTPVSDRSDLMPPLRSDRRTEWQIVDQPDGSHVVFDLPENFESFLSRLSKKRRNQFRRDVTNLKEAFGMESRVRSPDRAGFLDFVTFHNRQWQAIGMGGHFSDWPGSPAFYAELASHHASPIVFHDLVGRNGLLATQFVLRSGRVVHWRLPARSLDPKAEHMSIGKVGLLRMIAALIAETVVCIEAGRGEYDYKIAYGGSSVPVSRLIAAPVTRIGRFRLQILLAWADLVNLLYYRFWFLKLGPRVRQRFGLKPRPLRWHWIRTRL